MPWERRGEGKERQFIGAKLRKSAETTAPSERDHFVDDQESEFYVSENLLV